MLRRFVLCLLVLFLHLPLSTMAAETAFSSLGTVSTGATPYANVLEDLNGDGALDLVTANYYGNDATVLLGDGSGGFAEAQGSPLFVGTGPASVVAGDFDGDGDQDLATANSASNNVSVLLGTGDGTFAAAVNYAVGTTPLALAVGDFDGDGDQDLATANFGSDNASILLGAGDGTFAAAVNYAVGSDPIAVAAVDFDGDGDQDLAVANETSNNVSILLCNGDGTFQAAVNTAVGTAPEAIAVGDFSGDAAVDLAVVNAGSNNVSILLSNGDGTFQAAVNFAAGSAPLSIVAADFNVDGNLDLVTANYLDQSVSALRGNGDGTFEAAIDYPVGLGPRDLAAGDFDNDGKTDLAVVNESDADISILANATVLPVWTTLFPQSRTISITSAEVSVNADTTGNAYLVCLASGAAAPTSYQVRAGQNAADAVQAANRKAAVAITANVTATMTCTSLAAGSSYDLYVVAADGEGSLQAIPTLLPFALQAGTPSSLTVPVTDPDGSYTVSWGASATPSSTYVLEEATNDTFTTGLRTAYTGAGVSIGISGRASGVTYYYRVKATKAGYVASDWRVAGNGCLVSVPCVTPSSLTVPATDPDGTYSVSWGTSTTPGAAYVLEEATNSGFTTGLTQVYSGTGTTTSLAGRSSGVTYYYRVKATKMGYTDSSWKTAANGCAVTFPCVVPASLTVPATDPDGTYSVSWGTSTTPGATYVLEEATNSGFTTGLTPVYSGALTTVEVTGRSSGVTYYYRVKAVSTGYSDSAWVTVANGCAVSIEGASPASLTVPTTDDDGSYTVSWGASTTAGVTYVLEEATNASFTTGVITAYSGTGTSVSLSGRASGVTYYYRVKTTKAGYADSSWTTTATGNGCVVTIICVAPASLTVPASDNDGSYSVSWGASTTVGVTYVVEEATDTAPTTWSQVYNGTGSSVTLSGRASGVTYYYRVTATKANYTDSTATTAANGCVVTITCAAPATLTVPATDPDGGYTVAWVASATSGVTYVLEEATDAAFLTAVTTYSGTATSASITGRASGVTYYYRVKAIKADYVDSGYTAGTNGCAVTLVCVAPATLTLPATDPDGGYTVSWAASTTAGVTYTLQEATNSTFTLGVRQAYSGTGTTANITGRVSGKTYYYRVRATKTGYTASAWRVASNGCLVTLPCAAPATVTVAATDTDGGYPVSWDASTTAGVTYTLQEATNSTFTIGVRQAYSGTGTTANITGRVGGKTYYYRVRATKTGFSASTWTPAANGCVVTIPCAAPATLTVPATDADGAYAVSWAASTTAGVTYTLQEATNSTFTLGLRQAYSGTGTTVNITGRISGKTYYYRVRATKTGYTASAWTAPASCAVTIACKVPSSITVPATDADGSYTVSWGTSLTAGVTYVLEEATDSLFTVNVRTAYSGSGFSASISGRTVGQTYYYRVKATKAGYTASAWRTGANGCALAANCAAPASLAVPVSDADGSYTVSWAASTTPGVTYILEEATKSDFSVGLSQVYTGTATSATLTGRSLNTTYYYRVKSTKVGYGDSGYRVSATGCAVPGTVTAATPPSITVPATDADGAFTVTWGASATAGVAYEVQEATNSTFTSGLRAVYTGTNRTVSITGRTVGNTYYYRVRATKAGVKNSAYRAGTVGCLVGP